MAARRGSKQQPKANPEPAPNVAPVYRVFRAPVAATEPAPAVTPAPGAARPGAARVFRRQRPAALEMSQHQPGCRFYPVACVPALWICEQGCTASRAPVRAGHPNYGGDGSTLSGEYSLNVDDLRADYSERSE